MTEKAISALQKFLDKLPVANDGQQNWLIDKTAEYRLSGYSIRDAKERAMRDWQDLITSRERREI